jgi:hypothetical protein
MARWIGGSGFSSINNIVHLADSDKNKAYSNEQS